MQLKKPKKRLNRRPSRCKSQDMSQDVTPLQVKSFDEPVEHELTLRK